MQRILDKIKEYNKIVITGHIRPDGDCYGSVLGLRDILRFNFKDKLVYCSLEDSKAFSFLAKSDVIEDSFFKDSLAIVCDVSDISRIFEKRILESNEVIIIDHHHNEPSFKTCNYIDNTSASTCELIYKFATSNNLVIPLDSCNSIFTGIVTDSGWFRYSSVKPSTFLAASHLLELGVSPHNISLELNKESLDYLKLKGYLLSNIGITKNNFIYLIIKKEDMLRFNVTREEAQNALSLIDKINGNLIYGLFIEDDLEIRIRLRSKGPNIIPIANRYGGGGHMMACGCKIDSFNDLDKFLNDIDEFIANC